MRINYIAYLDPFKFNGGGEMIMNSLLSYAKSLDYEIFITTMSPKQNNYIDDADITILCDVFNSPSSFSKFDRNFLNRIIAKGQYFHFDNSYVDTCNLDYLPCNGFSGINCEYKSMFEIKSNIKRREVTTKCFQANIIVESLYKNSLSNIFLSPLHYQKVSKMMGIEDKENFILRPTVDTTMFYDRGEERDIDYIFAGAISEAKGVGNLIEYFKGTDKKVVMIGKNIYGEKLDFAEYIGFIPYEEMPKYFNRAKNFIYLPRWPEPQGRVVVEAALCGCNLITNDNIGATSFDFDIGNQDNLRDSEQEFWNYIIGIKGS